ncbi:undecaprenyldiphospho-muramoylpentapeptide beta-N-acetylglucosaminyltransferase [Paenibacillus sp. HJGM_3]|uniref:undecaprenyldiphospho-muramoylpentapeptide beta-N-acetylglucosaminyltransferase n=1 Tax=Paenibacillus sp. HJGM_3 TaxID=3379816 RepID=UPI00385F8C0E
MRPRTIAFTGGGSAGHVTPNLALIGKLRESGWNVHYIGSGDGIERGMIEETGIPFHSISSGKLRRYFDLKNLKDPFKVMKGLWDAYRVLGRVKPKVVFSKGGFVSVPVVVAGWLRRIPVIIHESDMTPGLANKLSLPFASNVCVTFPETLALMPRGKAEFTGLPIREEVLNGSAARGRAFCDFHRQKPVLLIMGGSLGARAINDAVRAKLPELLERFQVVHLCGKGHVDPDLEARRGYKQFEFVSRELPDLLALADVVLSRSGSTSINEFLALRKPMLLIPLTKQASRGDQILNAESFRASGYCEVLPEEELTPEELLVRLSSLYDRRQQYIDRMEAGTRTDSLRRILALIDSIAG